MTTRLYDLAAEYRTLSEAIEANGGELTPELEDAFDAIEAPFGEKLDAIGAIIRELEADADARTREANRHAGKARTAGNGAARLKEYVKACMTLAGEKCVKGERFTFRVQGNGPSAKWTGDPDKIPAEFRREVPASVGFDAMAAIEAEKRGDDLPEGVIISRGTHLRIG